MNTIIASVGTALGIAALGGIALKSGIVGSCGSCAAPADTALSATATTTAVAFTGDTDRDPSAQTDTPRPQVGDIMPGFTLPAPVAPGDAASITLSEALSDGPAVVTFFRGSWCPYCRTALSDIQDNLSDIKAMGATVIAISPERPSATEQMDDDNDLGFFVAHDEDNALARRLGLVFTLDDATVEKYKDYGIDLPESNATDSWELPVPATYVIDRDGIIRFAYDDENYRDRVDLGKILSTLGRIADDG